MTDKVHPLVELLVARAKSHPDEFKDDTDTITTAASDRWWRAINVISRNGTDADKALLANTIGRIAMDKAHEWALDELLNGEERRAEDRRMKEETEKRYAAQTTLAALSQQAQLYGQAAQNSYQNALGSMAVPNQAASVNIGGETLTASMVQQIKKALGVK
jgi:hypothetical protein